MKMFRKLFYPFGVLYNFITITRNYLYDKSIFKSTSFKIPVIAIGNLSVGGTGKTPHIEYLIRLLSNKYKIATLSRGYKRASKGFVLADHKSNAKTLGDEPFQFFTKFKNIIVAVDSNRKNGIEQILALSNKPNLILLDDAFQHRKVKAGLYILLTTYNDFFYDDYLLPAGNLRENKSGANRADIIIVTKCPENLTEIEQDLIKKKIGIDKPIFFSTVIYDDYLYSKNLTIDIADVINQEKILVAGIANPKPFFDYLNSEKDILFPFSDHHNFSDKEVKAIKKVAQNKIIITTEKDYMRLKDTLLSDKLYYLPIKNAFLKNGKIFDKLVTDFVDQM